MKLHPIYLELPPGDIAYIKFIFESYEDVGIIRTMDNRKAIVVLLAMDDFLGTARAIVESIGGDIRLQEIPRPPDSRDDWFMTELIAAAAIPSEPASD